MENLIKGEISPQAGQFIDRLGKLTRVIGEKRGIDGPGRNAGQNRDLQVGTVSRQRL